MDIHKAVKSERSWSIGGDESPTWITIVEIEFTFGKLTGRGEAPTKKDSRQIAHCAIRTQLENESRASSIRR